MTSSQSQVEHAANTRIGEEGQLTIPKRYRGELGLDTGAPVAVLRVGEALMPIPERNRFRLLWNPSPPRSSAANSPPRICWIRCPRHESAFSLAATRNLPGRRATECGGRARKSMLFGPEPDSSSLLSSNNRPSAQPASSQPTLSAVEFLDHAGMSRRHILISSGQVAGAETPKSPGNGRQAWHSRMIVSPPATLIYCSPGGRSSRPAKYGRRISQVVTTSTADLPG